jgi:hypothetical protein
MKEATLTTTQSGPATVATTYFEAWRDNDIERVRPLLDPQVDFAGALGTTHGGEETLQGLAGMFAMTERVEVIKRWVHGPDVITWFELCTGEAGPIPVVNCSHVQDGLIKRIRVRVMITWDGTFDDSRFPLAAGRGPVRPDPIGPGGPAPTGCE